MAIGAEQKMSAYTGGGAGAQVDYFLKIDGIKGESADHKHAGEIAVESWSWGATQSGSFGHGSGGGAGKVSMQDFHFVMKANSASPLLFLSCASGKHIPTATLTVRKAGGSQEEYYTIKFSDVLVSSFQTGGSHGDVIPTDQISLNFAKIELSYQPQDAKGAVGSPIKAGWDQAKNVKV